MKEEPVSADDKQCPLCGLSNGCTAANGECWCFHKKVPIGLRRLVPDALKGKACICERCVDAYHAENPSAK